MGQRLFRAGAACFFYTVTKWIQQHFLEVFSYCPQRTEHKETESDTEDVARNPLHRRRANPLEFVA